MGHRDNFTPNLVVSRYQPHESSSMKLLNSFLANCFVMAQIGHLQEELNKVRNMNVHQCATNYVLHFQLVILMKTDDK